jgi:hypothetical protein
MSQESQHIPQRPAGWRMAIAILLIATSLGAPAFIPLVSGSGLSTGVKTILSGFLVVGIPQLLMVAAVALVGKPGFVYIKQQAMGKLRKLAPPREVTTMRYYIGLAMFFLPIVVAFLARIWRSGCRTSWTGAWGWACWAISFSWLACSSWAAISGTSSERCSSLGRRPGFPSHESRDSDDSERTGIRTRRLRIERVRVDLNRRYPWFSSYPGILRLSFQSPGEAMLLSVPT